MPPVTSREVRWLAGLSVLAVGGTVASSAAATLFSLLGADVIEAGNVDAGADRAGSEHQPAPARAPALGTAASVRAALSAQAHGSAAAGAGDMPGSLDLPETLGRADAVICDLDGTALADLGCASRDQYLDLVASATPQVWVTASAFGLSGSRSGWAGNELIYLAAGGILDRTRSKARNEPLKPAGFQGSILTGELAALAALHGLDISRRTSQRVHMEVSAQEAVIAGGVFLECSHRLLNCSGAGGAGRYVAPSGEYPCRDGHVFISVLEDHHWAGLVTAMGQPAWASQIATWADRIEHEDTITRELGRWTRAWAKHECADLLQANGVPATPVNGPADLLACAQLVDRGFFQPDGAQPRVPTLPTQVTADSSQPSSPLSAPPRAAGGAEAAAHRDGDGISGLRLLDISQVLGPPLAASWLGAMGADVVKVEDPSRLEMYRRRGPFIDGISDREHGAYFAAANHSKRSFTTSALTPEGRADLDSLIKWADVVIENQTGTRRIALRLGRQEMATLNDDLLVISSSGFGRQGPMSDHRAYGQNLQAFSGLLFLTRDADGQMCHVQTPWADTMTAVVIASLIASYALGNPPGFAWLDLSMAEVVIRRLGEFVVQAEASAVDGIPDGTAIPGWSPSSPFRCAGDTWLAVCVTSAQQAESLTALLRREQAAARAGGQSTGASQPGAADELALLCRTRRAHDLAILLQDCGVPACPVLSVDDILHDRHLEDRQFFARISIAQSGQRSLIGLPWRRVAHAPFHLGDVPMMGASRLQDIVGTPVDS
jgi:crotonobetainyl-CoA:carnitine CoA-transferase CaiB-like acyl-CoA transferase